MSGTIGPEALGRTPDWLPFQVDPATDEVVLLRMREQEYRAASFLDQRALRPGAEMRRMAWSELASAVAPGARRDVQYIFHIGNVGSTLISRLLGELDAVLALREPLALRTFCDMLGPLAPPGGRWAEEGEARLDALAALLSRTYRPEQRAMVKATSFTSEIAWRLVPAGSRALFVVARPQAYIENILAGENSRQTLQVMTPSRLARLRLRCAALDLDPAGLGDGRKAALGWACEMTSLEESAERLAPGSVMWTDFDAFLADPVAGLSRMAAHFGLAVDASTARAIAEGPLMRRYSKAPEYEYSPELRRQVLAQARWAHGAEIREALRWLAGLANHHPAVAQAIRRVAR